MSRDEQNNEEEYIEEVQERSSSKFSLLHYYEENARMISVVAGAVIVIVVGIWAYFKYYKPAQEEKANSELYMAERFFVQDSLDLVLNGDGINPGARDLAGSGSVSAMKASYMTGRTLMEKGQFEEAVSYLEDAEFDDMIVGPLAKCLVGDCYSEMEQYDKAASAYMKAADMDDNNFTAPYALRKAARVHEHLGNWDKAVTIYERIKEDYSETEYASQVEKYIARARTKAERS